jgi:hypothetical protein
MATLTSANMANAIVKLVAAEALPALMSNLVMGNLVNRQFEPTLGQAGDTVNVAIPPVLAANNLAEGGSVQAQTPSLGNAQIVLNTHAECSFILPDVTRAITAVDVLRTYMNPAVISVAEKIESDLLSLYPQFTFNSAQGGATAFDEARLDGAETALFTAKVPPAAPKFLVTSGTAYSEVRLLPRFSEFQTIGQAGVDALVTGQVGKLKDFVIVRSQLVAKPSSTTYNLAFARDAIALVMRRLPQPLPGTGAIAEYVEMGNFGMRVVLSYQPGTLAQQVTIDAFYGCGVLRNSFGVQVQSD